MFHLLVLLFLAHSASTVLSTTLSVEPTRIPTIGNNANTTITVNLDLVDSTTSPLDGATSAKCNIQPAPHGTTHTLNNTGATFPAEIISSTKIVCHGVPNVFAPGPGILVISILHQNTTQNTTSTLSANVSYFVPVDFALSKRPYIYETSGAILLRFDPIYFNSKEEQFKVTAELPAAGPHATWAWNSNDPRDSDFFSTFPNVVLPLSFLMLPPNVKSIHNDLSVTVTRISDGTNYIRSRRFHRAPPPLNNATGSYSQIDHTTNSVLLNGKIFQIQGYYMGTDHPSNSSFWLDYELGIIKNKLVPSGLNVALFYDLQWEPIDIQMKFLDGCYEAGFKVMYPLMSTTRFINHGGPFNQPALLKNLIANITFMKDHPAILGWYICDDCCSPQSDISLQSQVYQLIKDLDPYHVTIGAVDCGNSWMFTDTAPSWLDPQKNIVSMRNIPEATQPKLQLSLDVVMQENYDLNLTSHGGNGTWEGGVGSDGWFRHGVEFEPLVNCPGTIYSANYTDPNVQLLTSQWLGLITANMHDSLIFIYTDSYAWLIPQASLFSERVTYMKDALLASFGSVHHPFVYSNNVDVRTRGWAVPKDKIENTNEHCLGFVVVANVNLKNGINFDVNIVEQGKGGAGTKILPCNAKRMFDGKGVVIKVGKNGVLVDQIEAAATNVYCLVQVQV